MRSVQQRVLLSNAQCLVIRSVQQRGLLSNAQYPAVRIDEQCLLLSKLRCPVLRRVHMPTHTVSKSGMLFNLCKTYVTE